MMIESSDFIIHFSLLIPRQSDKAFHHIHFISYHIHCFFQFKNYPPFTAGSEYIFRRNEATIPNQKNH